MGFLNLEKVNVTPPPQEIASLIKGLLTIRPYEGRLFLERGWHWGGYLCFKAVSDRRKNLDSFRCDLQVWIHPSNWTQKTPAIRGLSFKGEALMKSSNTTIVFSGHVRVNERTQSESDNFVTQKSRKIFSSEDSLGRNFSLPSFFSKNGNSLFGTFFKLDQNPPLRVNF